MPPLLQLEEGDVKTLPLNGIRVIDLSRVFAMPYVGAFLADLGADVVKIDTHHAAFVDTTRTLTGPYPGNEPGSDYWNRAGTFQTLNRGKRSVTLDLRNRQGMDILLDLISISDIVLENFTPRVTRRFGLDYPSLREVRPDLVLVSNTGYGHSGPWSDFGAMASALESTHASGAFMGYLERDPAGNLLDGNIPNKIGNSYTDFLACWSAQLAIMGSLIRRAQTGEGVWVDLAMYQTGVSFFGEGFLDFVYNDRRVRRLGNRHESMSPHGCYPCLGQDRWVVLSVRDDVEWLAFCDAMGQPDLADDPRFSEPVVRHGNQQALDEIIGAWTAGHSQPEIVRKLNARGLPVAPVLHAGQLLEDEHLQSRGFFEEVEHPPKSGLGARQYLGRGWRLSKSDAAIQGPAPELGQHNQQILGRLLGLSGQEIDKLEEEEVISTALQPASTPNVVPLHRQEELGWIAGFVDEL